MTVLLALAASVMWGTSDFVGGSSSRRIGTANVLFSSQLLTLPLVVGVFIVGQGWHSRPAAVGWAAAAGAAGIIGLAALFKALSMGRMSIVAPISACGAVGPVVVGLLRGDPASGPVVIGIGCVLVGLVACARPPSADDPSTAPTWRPVLLAAVSAVAFGGVLVCLADAGRSSASMSVLVMRVTSLALVGGAVALTGGRSLPRCSISPSLVAIGVLDLAANGCYALAGRTGDLPVIGVLGSLYPAVTILLARRIDGERLGGLRGFGVVVTLAGVAFIGATQVAA